MNYFSCKTFYNFNQYNRPNFLSSWPERPLVRLIAFKFTAQISRQTSNTTFTSSDTMFARSKPCLSDSSSTQSFRKTWIVTLWNTMKAYQCHSLSFHWMISHKTKPNSPSLVAPRNTSPGPSTNTMVGVPVAGSALSAHFPFSNICNSKSTSLYPF